MLTLITRSPAVADTAVLDLQPFFAKAEKDKVRYQKALEECVPAPQCVLLIERFRTVLNLARLLREDELHVWHRAWLVTCLNKRGYWLSPKGTGELAASACVSTMHWTAVL